MRIGRKAVSEFRSSLDRIDAAPLSNVQFESSLIHIDDAASYAHSCVTRSRGVQRFW